MDISGKAVLAPKRSEGEAHSFAESLRKEGFAKGNAPGADPELGSACCKAFRAGDLASGLGAFSPDFTPALGEGMLDAIALAEGATEEMRRYEEKANRR